MSEFALHLAGLITPNSVLVQYDRPGHLFTIGTLFDNIASRIPRGWLLP